MLSLSEECVLDHGRVKRPFYLIQTISFEIETTQSFVLLYYLLKTIGLFFYSLIQYIWPCITNLVFHTFVLGNCLTRINLAYLEKSEKRLTAKVCCLSSLCPFPFFNASKACAGFEYSMKMYL